ncbi:hypothetical protein ACO0LV_13515 [Pseudactinotalea sp. Z1739]|uniref:hypothetical protein n=1 Tax=Pseudactinotalea sp. Z1739 TaxID=3413028 RepID=UPI003C7BF3F4
MIDQAFMGGLTAGLVANGAFALLLFLFRRTILKWARKQFPILDARKPHINFQTEELDEDGEFRTNVHISNAGDEPAYNVYVYMVESYPFGEFVIRALDAGEVRRPVLGIRDSLDFHGVDMVFDGCNATVVHQLWIEFENSSGVAYRTVAEPPSARGDVERTHPTKVIRRRLEQFPDFEMSGVMSEWKKVRSGKLTMVVPEPPVRRLRAQLSARIEFGRDYKYLREGSQSQIRERLARLVGPSAQ